MTLLAEALADRKQALMDITSLSTRVQAGSVKYADDEDADDEDPKTLLDQMDAAIAKFEALSVSINKANNTTMVTFDGRTMSIMESIALREVLLFRAKHYRALADHVSEAIHGRSRYGYGARTKDDVRQKATVDAKAIRTIADTASENVRRLDLAIQQQNWTTEVVIQPLSNGNGKGGKKKK